MANVIVTAEVKYRTVQKSGNKEISQQTWKKKFNFGSVTEAQYSALVAYTEAASEITDLIGE